MPKVKVPRKSTMVDMTAMTDVAFLLLTFFMLATKFKPDEPVTVNPPSSISEILVPDVDMMTITIDKNNHVFFGMEGQQYRAEMIKKIGVAHNVKFTDSQIKEFSLLSTFGIPIAQLPQFLDMKSEERAKIQQPGIPSDSLNNELGDWIWNARLSNNKVNIAIKGDQETQYPIVKRIMTTIQEKKLNRFYLITNMERGDEK